jgi:hypothetical protein
MKDDWSDAELEKIAADCKGRPVTTDGVLVGYVLKARVTADKQVIVTAMLDGDIMAEWRVI